VSAGLWVKLDRDESAAFAALSLRARGLHALLSKVSDGAGIVDARATDTRALAAEIARRLGATAGDRRWLAAELDELVSAGFLGRAAGEWVLVSGASKPTRVQREPNANATRTEHEPDTNTTRTLHEPNTKTDASPRNHSTEQPLSPDPSLREDQIRAERAPTHEPARTREGQPASGAWWLDPWAVVNRLRDRSQGKLALTLNGHERELARTLTALAAQRPQLADELDQWAALAARGEASWWRGAWTIGALLGRADESGRRAADGLLRCLDEAAARMPSKRPALRSVRPAEPVDVMTPERARELVDAARAKRAAQREVANG
jgi:hypothetical protein